MCMWMRFFSSKSANGTFLTDDCAFVWAGEKSERKIIVVYKSNVRDIFFLSQSDSEVEYSMKYIIIRRGHVMFRRGRLCHFVYFSRIYQNVWTLAKSIVKIRRRDKFWTRRFDGIMSVFCKRNATMRFRVFVNIILSRVLLRCHIEEIVIWFKSEKTMKFVS